MFVLVKQNKVWWQLMSSPIKASSRVTCTIIFKFYQYLAWYMEGHPLFNSLIPSETGMHHRNGSSLVQIMVWLDKTKPLFEPILTCYHWSTVTYQDIEAETKWPPFSRRHFKCIFVNENVRISIKISLKFVSKDLINDIPALVQIMAWCRSGDKPLSEPMMA